jgi:DNA-binding beta-propeller fold protein YncE
MFAVRYDAFVSDTGTVLATIPAPALRTGMAFTPDGTRLITVSEPAQSGDALLV